MSLRCPSSQLRGIGRLTGCRWIINVRGYANIVASSEPGAEVHGLVYDLTTLDEGTLDRNEGVPDAYTKETLMVDFWTIDNASGLNDASREFKTVEMLVYIDRKRTEDGEPMKEYIHRINMGIEDGLKQGIPKSYFDQTIRSYIPAEEEKISELEALARRQACSFSDES